MNYQPPHEVRDQEKLTSMIQLLESGGKLPPVLVCGNIALSGSHRLAAWEAVDMEPQVIQLDAADLVAAMSYVGLNPAYDQIQNFYEIEQAFHEIGIG